MTQAELTSISAVPDSGGAFKVTVYSPYIILNRTGLSLDVRSEGSKIFGSSSAAAGTSGIGDDGRKVMPVMFSFPHDQKKNRARIKVGDSDWSSPQSFDAIGSTYSVSLKSSSNRSQMSVGVSIVEGEGKVSCHCDAKANN
jgi:vacuolar protein sorting-associated protein 13A/C